MEIFSLFVKLLEICIRIVCEKLENYLLKDIRRSYFVNSAKGGYQWCFSKNNATSTKSLNSCTATLTDFHSNHSCLKFCFQYLVVVLWSSGQKSQQVNQKYSWSWMLSFFNRFFTSDHCTADMCKIFRFFSFAWFELDRNIVAGESIEYLFHLTCLFGEYVCIQKELGLLEKLLRNVLSISGEFVPLVQYFPYLAFIVRRQCFSKTEWDFLKT